MRMSGEIKLKRTERACDEGCFTLNDALILLGKSAAFNVNQNALLCVAGVDCRYMRVEVRDGVVTLVVDEKHPNA